MRKHELKVAAQYMDALKSGEKKFEVRRDDRGFQKGDILVLTRWGPSVSSTSFRMLTPNGWQASSPEEADTIERKIDYILTGGQFGIEPGFVVMSLSDPSPQSQP